MICMVHQTDGTEKCPMSFGLGGFQSQSLDYQLDLKVEEDESQIQIDNDVLTDFET
jgi:hypothetical protein